MLTISSAVRKLNQFNGLVHKERRIGHSRITHRVNERLPGLGPVLGVVELARIPHDLVHQLRQADGVGVGTGSGRFKAAGDRVGDVALVVGRVEVLAVPASGCRC